MLDEQPHNNQGETDLICWDDLSYASSDPAEDQAFEQAFQKALRKSAQQEQQRRDHPKYNLRDIDPPLEDPGKADCTPREQKYKTLHPSEAADDQWQGHEKRPKEGRHLAGKVSMVTPSPPRDQHTTTGGAHKTPRSRPIISLLAVNLWDLSPTTPLAARGLWGFSKETKST